MNTPESYRQEVLAHYLATQEQEFEVWEENWPAFLMFLKVRSQWRVTAFGDRTGLDYAAVLAVIDFENSPDKQQLFEDLRTIESGALEGLQQVKQKQ